MFVFLFFHSSTSASAPALAPAATSASLFWLFILMHRFAIRPLSNGNVYSDDWLDVIHKFLVFMCFHSHSRLLGWMVVWIHLYCSNSSRKYYSSSVLFPFDAMLCHSNPVWCALFIHLFNVFTADECLHFVKCRQGTRSPFSINDSCSAVPPKELWMHE